MNEPKQAVTDKNLLQSALPYGAISQIEYRVTEDYLLNGLAASGICIPAKLQNAVLKRQVEFMAGRRAYQLAFSTLTGKTAEPLHQDNQGRPLWPRGVVGSISHSQGVALACVASSKEYLSLGIDIELEVDAETATKLMPSILVASERHRLLTVDSQPQALNLAQVFTRVFAAKEALYKALNPLCNRFFGFEDAECLNISSKTGEFSIQLRTTLSEQFAKGRIFTGRFIQRDQHIIALIALSLNECSSWHNSIN